MAKIYHLLHLYTQNGGFLKSLLQDVQLPEIHMLNRPVGLSCGWNEYAWQRHFENILIYNVAMLYALTANVI